MMVNPADTAQVLELSLHGMAVGYLIGSRGGHNRLVFADEFRQNPSRPTLSLTTHPAFPKAGELISMPWRSHQRLHPVLSNLLPEGGLRELMAQTLDIHIDDEFALFAALGKDLPGALIARPAESPELSDTFLAPHHLSGRVEDAKPGPARFSLAGVQMKFSMAREAQRFTLPAGDSLGNWIVKTPSAIHPNVPENEFTAMTLAQLAGVDIPEIQLIETSQLSGLPDLNPSTEPFAYAIRRFDRDGSRRIHAEDFAQVLVKYPHEKYNGGNYEQIARIIHQYSGNALADMQQLARRLLVNILLANGDAHLKNWSLLYPDGATPVLAPAYDLVTTGVYMAHESKLALNLARNKAWNDMTFDHFERWATKAELPWRAIRPHLVDVMSAARDQWPRAIRELPILEGHRQKLVQHWRGLQSDFRVE